jgi:chromosome segregation ATPase
LKALQERLSEQSSEHTRELAKREAEREIVSEDLEALNDQYQQLNMAYESQAGKLAEAKVSRKETFDLCTRFERNLERSLEEFGALFEGPPRSTQRFYKECPSFSMEHLKPLQGASQTPPRSTVKHRNCLIVGGGGGSLQRRHV